MMYVMAAKLVLFGSVLRYFAPQLRVSFNFMVAKRSRGLFSAFRMACASPTLKVVGTGKPSFSTIFARFTSVQGPASARSSLCSGGVDAPWR